jgi:hypothetical protein
MTAIILAALPWVDITSFAFGLSRVEASPELSLALDSPAGLRIHPGNRAKQH